MSEVENHLAAIAEPAQSELRAVRETILANLPEGYEERVGSGMILYVVPHSRFPQGYHCNPKQPLMLAGLAAGKAYNSLHMLSLYMVPDHCEWFQKAHSERGTKLNMGKGCVRFKKAADLQLDLVGEAFAKMPVDEYLSRYLAALDRRPGRKEASPA
jgi:hypothetical protein